MQECVLFGNLVTIWSAIWNILLQRLKTDFVHHNGQYLTARVPLGSIIIAFCQWLQKSTINALLLDRRRGEVFLYCLWIHQRTPKHLRTFTRCHYFQWCSNNFAGFFDIIAFRPFTGVIPGCRMSRVTRNLLSADREFSIWFCWTNWSKESSRLPDSGGKYKLPASDHPGVSILNGVLVEKVVCLF